ncbi:hypothetical protein F5884DRAFT_368660 [Xylogone sp. PMI_703]|nr:hypothetical protein F5884DRAFT_368660 [Xylogone sp. PMI_703]
MDPLHITEFASERYFSKLRQLNANNNNNTTTATASNAANVPSAAEPAARADISGLPLEEANTFTLPLGHPRQRHAHAEILKPSEQKKRSLGHDLASLRTAQRRPTFSGSFGSLRSRVIHKSPRSSIEHQDDVVVDEITGSRRSTLCDLFLALPTELKAQIISPLPIHTILSMRLVSKSFHALVTLNESTIARYHVAHTLPPYSLRLYPPPDANKLNLHYLCSIWHRLHVASKLSTRISEQATKEIFLRTTEVQRREFEPQYQRMRQRLMPLVFAIFHFFETYRDLHVRHLANRGTPLSFQPFTLNPIECQVMAMYDDETLLKVHQVFPLVISSFSRRLRPPSYAGRIERSIKGYLKDRPADEVYTTTLAVGGLRQAQRFWETKGYNARRAAVDIWYGFITHGPVEPTPKSKMSLITSLGRKKTSPAIDAASAQAVAGHGMTSCNEWFCVKPTCVSARRSRPQDNLVFNTSLAAGPPMSPLPRDQLQLLLSDLQPLQNIWLQTAEALILERRIVERPQDIKRNTQVLLDLIRDDGTVVADDFLTRNALERTRTVNTNGQEGMDSPGGVSD